jgi:hypothetical protein
MEYDREARLKAKQDSVLQHIRNDFASEYLLEEELIAFGEKARHKVLDLADYLTLYSVKNRDTIWVEQIKEMIFRLFYDKNAGINISVDPIRKAGNEKPNLHDLFSDIDASPYESLAFGIADLRTTEPLHQEGRERYTGKLDCILRISGIKAQDTTMLSETSQQVTFITTRTIKQFGDGAALEVWQVFLAEIDDVK